MMTYAHMLSNIWKPTIDRRWEWKQGEDPNSKIKHELYVFDVTNSQYYLDYNKPSSHEYYQTKCEILEL